MNYEYGYKDACFDLFMHIIIIDLLYTVTHIYTRKHLLQIRILKMCVVIPVNTRLVFSEYF